MSVIYRDRDRYDDSRTSVSGARRDNGGYTTVKRYIVKEDDSRSAVGRDRRFIPDRGGERVEETRIVRREREVEEPIRREEPRYSTEELVIRRDRDDESRRDFGYRRPEASSSDRELVIRRTTERDEPRREVRDDMALARYDDRRDYRVSETRYRDDYEVVSPRQFEDRDLQRYTRNTEYFSPAPPPPQTIVIRQEPIIIRERIRDDDYQIVRKSDVDEERSVVRREPDRPRGGEEEYFYEKRVRERIDEDDRKSFRREISPHDSVSQVGRRRGEDYSSDDSMVYVRRTREGYESGEGSPDRRKNLAAGVIAGIGAAELLRNHKEKEGREVSHGAGRVGRDIGAGALGAIAAEGINRARSIHRSRSRRRRDSRSRSKSRRRSRSESGSRLKTLGAVGLGAAALAAAAAIAQKRMSKKDEEVPVRGRSSSRHRHESVAELANDPTADDARNPKHRNIRMAEAGAAGAAITALIDRARSKSRGREGRDRSRSRVRQAVPVVVGGLGSAALAGLYEKNKAKKEAEAIKIEERRRSRSRNRHGSEYYDGPREGTVSDPGLIEYGDGPMYGNNYGAEYYGRPPPQENFYGPQTAVVPAMAGAAGYEAARGPRSRSRSLSRDRGHRRSLSRSSSSSGGGRRRRDRSSNIETAAAAAGGAAAASEYERKKQEKRERKARRRQQEAYARDPYEEHYNPTPQPYTPTPPPAADPYANQPGYYGPQTSQFPPPPGAVPQQYAPAPVPPPATHYNPQDFPPPPPQPAPAGMPGYEAYGSGANPYAPRPRGADNVSVPPNPINGSSFPQNFPSDQPRVVDGVNGASRSIPPAVNVQPPSDATTSPRYVPQERSVNTPPTELSSTPTQPRSSSQPPPTGSRKSVQFAAAPEIQPLATESEASSPEQARRRHHDRTARGYEAGDDTDSTPDEMRRRSSARAAAAGGLDPEDYPNGTAEDGRGSDRKRRHHRRRSHDPSSSSSSRPNRNASSPDRVVSPAGSDATVDLPARFDRDGKKKPEPGDDPLADKLDEILHGKGAAGKLFGNFMDGLFGPDGRKKGSGSGGRVDDKR